MLRRDSKNLRERHNLSARIDCRIILRQTALRVFCPAMTTELSQRSLAPQDSPRSLGGGAGIFAGAQRALHEHQRAGGFDDFTLDGDEIADAHRSDELHVEADGRLLMAALGLRGRKAKRSIEQRRQHAVVGEAAAVTMLAGDDEAAQRAVAFATTPKGTDGFDERPGVDFLLTGRGWIK
jgi:hypothetical protein